ncbi:MAG: tetratricopeptide repeat protein [Terriglobia bacterium]
MPFNKSKALEEAAKLVGQKKLPQAIKQYLAIVEQDPADLSLLNTVGDLYVRDRNIPGALRQFYKLGAAYAHEGFGLKAIAIYKKIAKLDTRSADPLVKLAELYSSQGLSHEAREQYAQALSFCQSHSLQEKALEILGKLIGQDPENAVYRIRLGELHEAGGRAREASLAYLEAAEIAHRQKNAAAAKTALERASRLDRQNARVLLLEARMAVEGGRFEDAANLLNARPELKASREARLIRLETCLGAQKLDEAEALTLEIYLDNPADFETVERFTSRCFQAGNPDAGLRLMGAIADIALERQQAEPFTAFLHRLLQAYPQRAAVLELIYAICERPKCARHGSELLEGLAAASVRAEQWAIAEEIYGKLIKRGGDKAVLQVLLNEALAKQGKAREKAQSAEAPTAFDVDGEAVVAKPAASTESGLASEPLPVAETSESLKSSPASEDRETEIDFSSEWEEYASIHSQRAGPGALEPLPPLGEEEKTEIQFYFEYGFFAEARAGLQKLEAAYPGHPDLAEFWKKLKDAQTVDDPAAETGGITAASSAPSLAENQAPRGSLLDDLRLDLENSLDEPPAIRTPVVGYGQGDSSMTGNPDSFSSALHDLLAELEIEQQEDSSQDTPQAHYNLGVAFREMGLLDEAIGEFQKIARGADRQTFPPRFVESCSLLGSCFMEKRMPAIAVRWYRRALEAPGNDEETTLGLNYDLGLAYEQSGDAKAALDRFSEVYSLNIDYQDVAEKIRSLQHKAR